MTLSRTTALTTLAAFLFLFAIVSNLYQPTMEFNLHCTVHERVIEVFGGVCEGTAMGLFTSIAAFFTAATILFFALAWCVHVFADAANAIISPHAARAFVFASPPHHLQNYYHHGIAQTR